MTVALTVGVVGLVWNCWVAYPSSLLSSHSVLASPSSSFCQCLWYVRSGVRSLGAHHTDRVALTINACGLVSDNAVVNSDYGESENVPTFCDHWQYHLGGRERRA